MKCPLRTRMPSYDGTPDIGGSVGTARFGEIVVQAVLAQAARAD
ncbi:MAG: hypothetical protein U1E60_13480 [Reyranellaceae bacterium]